MNAGETVNDPAAGAGIRAVVTHPDAQEARSWVGAMLARLPGARVTAWPEGAADADFAIGWNPPRGFFESAPALRAFFSLGAGVDHLRSHPVLPAGLRVIRIEDAGMGRQMVEYCCHEVIRHHRRFADYEALQREGRWEELAVHPREEFGVGVLGLGVLGAQVARAVSALGYPVSAFTRSPRRVEGLACFSGDDGLEAFLGRSRLLVLLAPLTDETRDLIDARRLAMLPKGAWLVNVARGALVVDDDLLAAIDRGHLAGATLDVFRTEPLPPEHPFWRHPRIRITPHVSALTLLDASADQIAAKLVRMQRGEPVGGEVERGRGY